MFGWLKERMDEAMASWRRERNTAALRKAVQLRYTRLRLEALEDRVMLDSDLLIWNPSPDDLTFLASHRDNWYDQTKQMQGFEAPGWGASGGQTVWLDGQYSNNSIIWDQRVTLNNLLLTSGQGGAGGNGNSYTGQQTIDGGITVTCANGVGFSGQNGSLNINFKDANSRLIISGGNNVWESIKFTETSLTPVDGVDITGGSVEIGSSISVTNLTQVGITISNNATVFLDGQVPLTLANNIGYVNVNGLNAMLYMDGSPADSTVFINGDGTNNIGTGTEEVQINNNGEVYYNGVIGEINKVAVPIWNNGGLLRLSGGGNLFQKGATLEVMGGTSDTQGESVYMDSGDTYLMGVVTLQTDNGYMQMGNCTLETGDGAADTLYSSNVLIGSGSFVKPYANGTDFGQLTIIGNLFMNGTYQASCDSKSNNCTAIVVIGGSWTWSGDGGAISMWVYGTGNISGNSYRLGSAQSGGVSGSPASVPSGWSYWNTGTAFGLQAS